MDEMNKKYEGLPEIPDGAGPADADSAEPEETAEGSGSLPDPGIDELLTDAEDLPPVPGEASDESGSGLFAEPDELPEREAGLQTGSAEDMPEEAPAENDVPEEASAEEDAPQEAPSEEEEPEGVSAEEDAPEEVPAEEDEEYAPPVRRRKRRPRPEGAPEDGQLKKKRRPRPEEDASEDGAPVRRRRRAEGAAEEDAPVRKRKRPAEGPAPEGAPVRKKRQPAEDAAGENAPRRKRRAPEDGAKKPREESSDPRIARMMREREERNAKRAARRRREMIRQGAILLVSALVLLFLILLLFNQKRTMVKLIGKKRVTVEAGGDWEDPGAKAVYGGRTLPFGRTEIPYETATDLDLHKVGTYSISYHAEYGGREGHAVRTVIVKDTTAPVITLTEDPDWYTLPGAEYEEEGFTAEDSCDGDLTDSVVREEKDGKVYYSVTDSSGNVGTAEREIVYDDKGAPDLMLYNALPVIEVGEEWTDAYYAEDDLDGDVTDKVIVTGEVDTDEPGTYTIEYSVTDEHGNEATAEREVRVVEELTEDELPDQTIFLTFDDGPYEYTDELLDILDKYNVKATFFVTAQFEDYLDCIEREADEGHTVAVHTYKHRFADVYESTDAYWEDFEKMNDIIEEQTGERTELFRFPGGSSNTISRRYSEGIMSELTDQAKDRGLDYYDWNVSSGDAGEYTDSFEIWDTITDQIWEHKCSVILCHDIHEYTVDCIEDVITYALDHGFSFMPLRKGIYTCHHPVNN